MEYKIEFKPKAIKDLKRIDKKSQNLIIRRIEKMSDNLYGDVKRLTNYTPEYRLRVGTYRVLFEVDDNTIIIFTVFNRRESYR